MNEIQQMSATALVAAIRRREVSAREALDAHLERIEQVNPEINAVVTLDPERALADAEAADRRTVSGAALPPLHGLPMTHKDTHAVAGTRSTSGSRIFADHVPVQDDAIIARLRRAGVVSTGKSNVPEFGAGSHTFNDVFGTTTNPYAPRLSAGGSSGGLAAAVASGIQPLGEGSDMGGSLRIPASFCGVVGFRPSHGVIPTPPPGDDWAWLTRTGPMAREVSDVALFMFAVAGPSPRVRPPAPVTGSDFTGPLLGDLRGVRVAWSPDLGLGLPVEPEVLAVLEGRLRVFEEAGAIVEEATPDLTDAEEVFRTTRALDFAAALGPLVREHRDLVKPEVVGNVEAGWALSAREIVAATGARTRLAAALRAFHARYDLLVSPAAQVLPFDARLRYPAAVDGVEGTGYLDWMRSACALSATGLPVLALPAGFTGSGLPVGFQLSVDHYRDADLLRLGKAFEDRTRCVDRRPEIRAGTGQRVRPVTTVAAR
ncbi:amidase [Nocardiopsis sp. NPDC058789]|uniref:amidase n=1 Tax=Nocardiopsis sp. NPDC058789 TaxID=3346634 RepID=UPI00366D5BF6